MAKQNIRHGHMVWFEIPVRNLNRALIFYSALLQTKITIEKLFNTQYGIFKRQDIGVGGVLKESIDQDTIHHGVVLFFYVNILSEALQTVEDFGGKILMNKTLLKQYNTEGKSILAQNLIDNEIGYYAEVEDSEGNKLALYSHY